MKQRITAGKPWTLEPYPEGTTWTCFNAHGPFPEDFEPDFCPVVGCGLPLIRKVLAIDCSDDAPSG